MVLLHYMEEIETKLVEDLNSTVNHKLCMEADAWLVQRDSSVVSGQFLGGTKACNMVQ